MVKNTNLIKYSEHKWISASPVYMFNGPKTLKSQNVLTVRKQKRLKRKMKTSEDGVPKKTLNKALNIHVTIFGVTFKSLVEFPATFSQVFKFRMAFYFHKG